MASLTDARLPHGSAPPAYLYVIELNVDRIKIGYTTDPIGRLRQHRGMARAHGITPDREWVSPTGAGTPQREAQLIAYCKDRAQEQVRIEYFVGMPFELAALQAARLCEDVDAVGQFAEAAQQLAENEERAAIAAVAGELAEFDAGVAALTAGQALGRIALRTQEATELLGVTQEQMRGLIKAGQLRCVGRSRSLLALGEVRQYLIRRGAKPA